MKKQLVFAAVFCFVIFGLGFAGSARAENVYYYGDSIGNVVVTPSDLGVDSVGTLPTSPFYFFKEWKRGLTRLFTFDSVAKAQLELNITNQIAAEVLEVAKAYDACAANALGGGKSCKPEDKVGAVKNALQNFTNAQERLNFRITTINGTSNVVDSERFLKAVDEKTAKHAALLEQVSARMTFTRTGNCGAFCRQYEELQSFVDN
ncbi:MAG: hypothetical protein Q7R90_00505, partial [bacterium]|nr:hypothetical protein [bacterium]